MFSQRYWLVCRRNMKKIVNLIKKLCSLFAIIGLVLAFKGVLEVHYILISTVLFLFSFTLWMIELENNPKEHIWDKNEKINKMATEWPET